MPTVNVTRIPAGKTEAYKRIIHEMLTDHGAENADLNRRAGITEEYHFIVSGPDGDDAVAFFAGDPVPLHQVMDPTSNAFDRWLKEQLDSIYGAGASQQAASRCELIGHARVD